VRGTWWRKEIDVIAKIMALLLLPFLGHYMRSYSDSGFYPNLSCHQDLSKKVV
jgi:hypothetical protein